MKTLAATLLALPFAYAGSDLHVEQETTSPAQTRLELADAQPKRAPTAAKQTYLLQWDDSLDGDLNRPFKQCVVEIQRIDKTLSGRFIGDVLGEPRTATFTGEAAGTGQDSLWILQQREPGYLCSYQLSSSRLGAWDGTWRDSRGRTGSVRLWPAPVSQGPNDGARDGRRRAF